MALGMLGMEARGDIIPTFVSVVAEGPNFRFTYDSTVTAVQRVDPGDFFTIYDFVGFIPGSNLQPGGWDFVSLLGGVTPGNVFPADDPTLPNLTWTRTGASVAGPASLGSFSALSAFSLIVLDNYTGRGTNNDATDPAFNTKNGNIGFTTVPSAVPVPEPTTLAMAAIGLPILMGARFVRRRMGSRLAF